MGDMPSSQPPSLEQRRTSALNEVSQWFESLELAPKPRPLIEQELRAYSNHSFIAGWRLSLQDESCLELDILFAASFPWAAPRVAIVGDKKFLTWPHVEPDNLLCLLPEYAEVDPRNPLAIAKSTLADAVQLIDECLAEKNENDFRSEFYSYWNKTVVEGVQEVRSLLDLSKSSSRIIRLWRGTNTIIAGEDDDSIIRWMLNITGNAKFDKETVSAGFLWLEKPLLPKEYPVYPNDIFRLCGEVAAPILLELVSNSANQFQIVFAANSDNGPCVHAVTIRKPKTAYMGDDKRGPDPVTKGFRPGNVPKDLLLKRYLGSGSLTKATVARVDSNWVHGRDQDPDHANLKSKRVVIIGCGSLGSETAALLAESGVGKLALIDPDDLNWSNVGRHHLGASSVGHNKAKALSQKLSKDYPHLLEFTAFSSSWQKVGKQAELDSCDLIISAVGSWNSEGALNQWHLANGRKIPIIYTWLEPFGAASHAIAITKDGACFGCNLKVGKPNFNLTDWKVRPSKQEPACGVFYQPYGPSVLMRAACLTLDLALDCLLGNISVPTHRMWFGNKSLLDRMKGEWTAVAIKLLGSRISGQLIHEEEYPLNVKCPECCK